MPTLHRPLIPSGTQCHFNYNVITNIDFLHFYLLRNKQVVQFLTLNKKTRIIISRTSNIIMSVSPEIRNRGLNQMKSQRCNKTGVIDIENNTV